MSKPTAGVDLNAIDTVAASNRGAEIQLKHPVTLEPMPAYITVLGKDSDAFKQTFRKKVNGRIAREAIAKKRGQNVEPPTIEDGEEDAIDLLVACTVGWRGLMRGDQAIEFSPEAARDLYRSTEWIRTQVDTAIADLALFMKS